MEWLRSGDVLRFQVVAATREDAGRIALTVSEPLAWPPTDASSTRALSHAVGDLEARMLAAGWRPLPPGTAWYAKRFAWDPVVTPPPPGPRSTLTSLDAPKARLRKARRFVRHRPWPEGATNLWRCEICWSAGWVSSRFEVIAYPPEQAQGRLIGGSSAFSWKLRAEPDPGSPRHRAEMRSLVAALERTGWEPVDRGRDWYGERFVWRADGTPPELIAALPSENGHLPSGTD